MNTKLKVMFCSLLLTSTPASSLLIQQGDSYGNVARELMIVMELDKRFTQIAGQAIENQFQFNPDMRQYEDAFRKFYSNPQLIEAFIDGMAKVYMEVFSEEELRDMITFYETETGKKSIEKEPILMMKLVGLAEAIFLEYSAKFDEIVFESTEELQEPDIPNGLWTDYHDNGTKKEEGNFEDGKKDGLWMMWYENGQKMEEGIYREGKPDGFWKEWHDNGSEKSEATFKNGKPIGKWTFWYENGKKKAEENYINGKPIGKWTYYNEDGSIKEVKDYGGE